GGALSASCVLVASGVSYRQLDAPGFAELTGAGIYYGATVTEARSCTDQHVVIIGGANSAGQAAVYFSRYAGRVTMLVRGDPLATTVHGVFVAGDVRARSIKRVASAVGEGSMAVSLIHQYLVDA